MAFKLSFLILCTIFIYQISAFTVSRKERDTKDASNTIDGLVSDLKTGLEDLVTKMQNNEVLQNISVNMQQLGQEFADGTKKLAEDTQRAFKTK